MMSKAILNHFFVRSMAGRQGLATIHWKFRRTTTCFGVHPAIYESPRYRPEFTLRWHSLSLCGSSETPPQDSSFHRQPNFYDRLLQTYSTYDGRVSIDELIKVDGMYCLCKFNLTY